MQTQPTNSARTWSGGSLALLASAVVLTALILVQTGRLVGVSAAQADVTARVGDFSTLTFNAGSDDVLAVLDGRAEQLFTYRIKGQNQVEFLRRYDLKELFANGRRLGPSRK